ncbi:MAG: hypothetical protein ACAI44_27590 [Candidatus Sericytochromatia bacterium]
MGSLQKAFRSMALMLLGAIALTAPLQAQTLTQPADQLTQASSHTGETLERQLDCHESQQNTEPADPTLHGKYKVLLHKLWIPEDCAYYSSFDDWGFWSGTEYKGFRELQQGYWVYAYPYWYVYKEIRNPELVPVPEPEWIEQ